MKGALKNTGTREFEQFNGNSIPLLFIAAAFARNSRERVFAPVWGIALPRRARESDSEISKKWFLISLKTSTPERMKNTSFPQT